MDRGWIGVLTKYRLDRAAAGAAPSRAGVEPADATRVARVVAVAVGFAGIQRVQTVEAAGRRLTALRQEDGAEQEHAGQDQLGGSSLHGRPLLVEQGPRQPP